MRKKLLVFLILGLFVVLMAGAQQGELYDNWGKVKAQTLGWEMSQEEIKVLGERTPAVTTPSTGSLVGWTCPICWTLYGTKKEVDACEIKCQEKQRTKKIFNEINDFKLGDVVIPVLPLIARNKQFKEIEIGVVVPTMSRKGKVIEITKSYIVVEWENGEISEIESAYLMEAGANDR